MARGALCEGGKDGRWEGTELAGMQRRGAGESDRAKAWRGGGGCAYIHPSLQPSRGKGGIVNRIEQALTH